MHNVLCTILFPLYLDKGDPDMHTELTSFRKNAN